MPCTESTAPRRDRKSVGPADYHPPTFLSTSVTLDRRLALAALSVFGWAVGAALWLHLTNGRLQPGNDLQAYIRAGGDLLAGRPVYTSSIGQSLAFAYAPPWAVLFAAIGWLPGASLQLAMIVLDMLALRYISGSWQRIGLAMLFPITIYVIVAGNLEILIAAAIVLAWRTASVEPLVFLALAKIGPALALPPRHWRSGLLALVGAVAITVPWFALWADWLAYLLHQPVAIAISLPAGPWYYRLPFALALLLLRRPWAAALASVVAMPSLYLSTAIVLLAPIRLYLDARGARMSEHGQAMAPYHRKHVTASTRPTVVDRTRATLTDLGHRVFGHVPAWLGGHLHRLPTRWTFGLTGPFNGQKRRQAAVAAVFHAVPFKTVIETGTFRALTTMYLRRLSTAPIATIEVNSRYYEYSRRRLAKLNAVHQFLGHSPAVLDRLRRDAEWQGQPCFFYLDAHWLDDLPLLDELHVIGQGWHDFAALIDDFRVDGDDGYFFDDYGPGKTLALPLLREDPELADLHVFWPAAASTRETGARRGWVLLASPGSVANALVNIPELRAAGTVASATHG